MSSQLLAAARSHLEHDAELDRAEESARQAFELCQQERSWSDAATALRLLLRAKTLRGDDDGALALAAEVACPEVQATALLCQAELLLSRGESSQAQLVGAEALEAFKLAGDRAGEMDVVRNIEILSRVTEGRFVDAATVADAALQRCEEYGDRSLVAAALLAQMGPRLGMSSRRALEPVRRARLLYVELGDVEGEVRAWLALAAGHLQQRSFPEAAECCKEAWSRAGDSRRGLEALRLLLAIKLEAGEASDVVELLEEELRAARASVVVHLQLLLVRALLGAGRAEEAEARARAVADAHEAEARTQARAHFALAEVLMAQEQATAAKQAAEQAAALFGEAGDQVCRREALRLLDRLSVQMGQVHLAPNRSKALELLAELAAAAEALDEARFRRIACRLDAVPCVSAEEIQAALAPAMRRHPEQLRALLQLHGGDVGGGATEVRASGKVMWRDAWYQCFLRGGMNYGRAFRLCNTAAAVKGTGRAYCVLRLHDDAEAWEREAMTHPGLLDCLLQSQAAVHYTNKEDLQDVVARLKDDETLQVPTWEENLQAAGARS